MSFSTRRVNEWAGLVLYRTAKGYDSLLKGKNEIRLTKVLLGSVAIIVFLPRSTFVKRISFFPFSKDVYKRQPCYGLYAGYND